MGTTRLFRPKTSYTKKQVVGPEKNFSEERNNPHPSKFPVYCVNLLNKVLT